MNGGPLCVKGMQNFIRFERFANGDYETMV